MSGRALERVTDAVAALSARNPIILIDGPSGAGKSTLAEALVAAWPRTDAGGAESEPPQLVRLDDLYPGWSGLARGSRAVATLLLEPLRRTGTGRWRSWNWAADRPGEWHEVRADRPLVVEGCGALSQASARLADLRIWLSAESELRKRRALARDRGAFDAHWDGWEAQFAEFVTSQHPLALADLILDGTRAPSPTSRAGSRFSA